MALILTLCTLCYLYVATNFVKARFKEDKLVWTASQTSFEISAILIAALLPLLMVVGLFIVLFAKKE